jgi:hypothetical protein
VIDKKRNSVHNTFTECGVWQNFLLYGPVLERNDQSTVSDITHLLLICVLWIQVSKAQSLDIWVFL